MRIGIIEHSDKNLTELFMSGVSAQIADVSFERKKALDAFDALAFTKAMASAKDEDYVDQLVLIVELDEEDKTKNDAFYKSLASLEADTGRNVFKCIFMTGSGEDEVKELAETFIKYLFKPEELAKEPEEEEEAEADVFAAEEEEGPAGPFEEAP